MSCEGCPLIGNCPASKIGEAAFTGEVTVEDTTTQQQSGVEDFNLVRLAVSADPDSLIAQRCADQLEESATPMTALLEAGPSVAGSYAESEATSQQASIPDLEQAQATLKSEGGISAHKNRYSGRDPAECPMIGSMGQAGLEMVEKLEAAEKDPSRGKTIAELLAERNQQQPSAKPEKPAVVKAQAAPKQETHSVDQREVAALPLAEPLAGIETPPQARVSQEAATAPISKPVREAAVLDVDVKDHKVDLPAAQPQISVAKAPQPSLRVLKPEDPPVEAAAAVAQPVGANAPNIAKPVVSAAEPQSLTEIRPVPDQIVLSDEIEINEENRTDTAEVFVPALTIAPDESQPAVIAHPDVMPILPDDEISFTADQLEPFYKVDDDSAENAVLSVIEEEIHEEAPLVNVFAEISMQELGVEQTRLETFEAALTEWLANVTPGTGQTAPVVDETLSAEPQTQPQTEQLAIEHFEPEIQAKITDVLESMTQLYTDISLERERPVEAKDSQPLDVEAIARQFEPLCEQLLEVMELAPNEAAIKAIAAEIAVFVASAPRAELDSLSSEELNALGTREYKQRLSSTLQTHLVRPMRQKIKRLIALSRHILDYMSRQQPQVAGALA